MNNILLASFEYENKIFYIFIDKDKNIKYAYLDKQGELHFDFNETEAEILTAAFNSLLVDEQRTHYARTETLNDKVYKIYFDPQTKRYFWKSNTSEIDIDANVFFNMKYNNMPDVIYSRIDEEDDLDFSNWRGFDREVIDTHRKNYERRVRELEAAAKNDPYNQKYYWSLIATEKKYYHRHIFIPKLRIFIKAFVNAAAVILLAGSMIFLSHIGHVSIEALKANQPQIEIVETFGTDYTEPNIIETTATATSPTEVNDGYDYEKIRQAIERNPNLSDDEKNFLYKLQFVFDENHEYMNLEMVIARLESLSVSYVNGPSEQSGVYGLYKVSENHIQNFYSTSFADVKIVTFLHEFFHVLQGNDYGRIFKELSNQNFTIETMRRLMEMGELDGYHIKTEYSGAYNYGEEGYSEYMHLYYYLAELLPDESLRKYQFECNDYYIISALYNNTETQTHESWQKAWELFDAMDELEENGTPWGPWPADEEEVISMINYFYGLNGTSIEENANCFACDIIYSLSPTDEEYSFLLNEFGRSQYEECNDIRLHVGAEMKSYFSDEDSTSTIYYTFQSSTDEGIAILESNGDYQANYTAAVDEDFQAEYSNFVNSTIMSVQNTSTGNISTHN